MPEGTLQLEHLMQTTKLLQLKKATATDIEFIYDVCWILTPTQIQRMCTNYYVADYEVCFAHCVCDLRMADIIHRRQSHPRYCVSLHRA